MKENNMKEINIKAKIIPLLYVGVVVIYLFFDEGMIYDRLMDMQNISKIIYVLINLLFFCLLICLGLNCGKGNIILIIILFIGLSLDYIFCNIYGKTIDIVNLSVILGAVENITDAIDTYSFEIICGILKAGVIASVLFILRKYAYKNNYMSVLLFILLILSYIAILLIKGVTGTIGFPKGINSLGCFISVAINNINKNKDKEKISHVTSYEAYRCEKFNTCKIILVIDESVEREYFKEQLSQLNIGEYVFFENSYSAANNSAASNFILRKGRYIWKDGGKISKMFIFPSLFEVAKQSNMTTYYIDNQNILTSQGIRNYFTEDEVKFIDRVYNNEKYADYDKDIRSVDQIGEFIEAGKRSFIVINKSGSHFPYYKRIQKGKVKFNRVDDYKTSIHDNTIEFLNKLYSKIDDETIILYTSDHGQNVENGVTHGNSGANVKINEYSIPIIVISKNNKLLHLMKQAQGLQTHFAISETILNLMGFKTAFDNSFFQKKKEEEFCGIIGQPYSFFKGDIPCFYINENKNKNK